MEPVQKYVIGVWQNGYLRLLPHHFLQSDTSYIMDTHGVIESEDMATSLAKSVDPRLFPLVMTEELGNVLVPLKKRGEAIG